MKTARRVVATTAAVLALSTPFNMPSAGEAASASADVAAEDDDDAFVRLGSAEEAREHHQATRELVPRTVELTSDSCELTPDFPALTFQRNGAFFIVVDGRCGPNPTHSTNLYQEPSRSLGHAGFSADNGDVLEVMCWTTGQKITNSAGVSSDKWIAVHSPNPGFIDTVGHIASTWTGFTADNPDFQAHVPACGD